LGGHAGKWGGGANKDERRVEDLRTRQTVKSSSLRLLRQLPQRKLGKVVSG